jgi:1,4-alpha-glucan branching enzyme
MVPVAVLSPSILANEGESMRKVFSLEAPNAKYVELDAEWEKENIPFTRGDDGVWSVTLESIPAGIWQYRFMVDGLNILDPNNPAVKPQQRLVHNLLHIPATLAWRGPNRQCGWCIIFCISLPRLSYEKTLSFFFYKDL